MKFSHENSLLIGEVKELKKNLQQSQHSFKVKLFEMDDLIMKLTKENTQKALETKEKRKLILKQIDSKDEIINFEECVICIEPLPNIEDKEVAEHK